MLKEFILFYLRHNSHLHKNITGHLTIFTIFFYPHNGTKWRSQGIEKKVLIIKKWINEHKFILSIDCTIMYSTKYTHKKVLWWLLNVLCYDRTNYKLKYHKSNHHKSKSICTVESIHNFKQFHGKFQQILLPLFISAASVQENEQRLTGTQRDKMRCMLFYPLTEDERNNDASQNKVLEKLF